MSTGELAAALAAHPGVTVREQWGVRTDYPARPKGILCARPARTEDEWWDGCHATAQGIIDANTELGKIAGPPGRLIRRYVVTTATEEADTDTSSVLAQRLRRLAREPAGNIHRVADALLVAHALRDAAESMTFDRVAWRELTALLVAVDLLDGRQVDAEGREVLDRVLAEWAGRT